MISIFSWEYKRNQQQSQWYGEIRQQTQVQQLTECLSSKNNQWRVLYVVLYVVYAAYRRNLVYLFFFSFTLDSSWDLFGKHVSNDFFFSPSNF